MDIKYVIKLLNLRNTPEDPSLEIVLAPENEQLARWKSTCQTLTIYFTCTHSIFSESYPSADQLLPWQPELCKKTFLWLYGDQFLFSF